MTHPRSRMIAWRRWRTLVLAAGILGAGALWAQAQQPAPRPALERGGSDYVFYGLYGCGQAGLFAAPSYDAHRDTIDAQLTAMYRDGQRRLRIGLPLDPDPAKGPFTRGPLIPEYRQSIVDFLKALRRTGFQEVEVVIGGGSPSPLAWKAWDEAAYKARWQRLVEIRNLLIASGLHYRLDLFNEGIPARNQPMLLLRYVQRLWADYVGAFGVADTVGFSIIPLIAQDRFAQIPAVYQGRLPPVFDLHIYDRPEATVLNAHRRLAQLGLGGVPWIIGETFYNDRDEATALASAIAATGQRVLFVMQWPLTSQRRCRGIDVAFPARFDEYIAKGF
ncbi:MAG TPA: hypothetical protein VKQ73_13295 [Stellaceae bacterium]|nr:hypothetical protein [Stellaceae bacterium]